MNPSPDTIAALLLDRLGDQRDGLRTHAATWTWDEVVRESAACATLARSLRRPGPFHIGVLLENVPEYLFWLGGAALAGATVVGINPTRRGSQLEREVARTDCQLIVTDSAGFDLLEGLDVGVTRERILLVDEPAYQQRVAAARADEPEADAEVSASTRMLLLLTSGTTGTSKAAICSQGRLAGLGQRNREKYDIGPGDVCYCPMPLFHGNALMACWAPALAAGACVALPPRFSASQFLPDVRSFAATFFTYVGKAIAYVLATPEREDDRDNPLTHAFGTEASPEDRTEFDRRFGCRLIEGYGSSEGAGHVALDPEAPEGALGRPASAAVAVVDPVTREEKAPAVLGPHGAVTNPEEAIGEIVNKRAASRFEGYYNDPAANAERVRHGWYWTGDLGYLDEAGFLYFAGRSGDWIRVDGENISALHIERVVRRHPDIVLAGAFGVPDPRTGDQVMLAVEPTSPDAFDITTLGPFLADQADLVTKGAPRFVRVCDELPTTGSNKVLKRSLQAEAWVCDDPVYRWKGRSGPEYRRMTSDDIDELIAAFEASGRRRFLPDTVAVPAAQPS